MNYREIFTKAAENIILRNDAHAGYEVTGRAFDLWLELYKDAPLLADLSVNEAALAFCFLAEVSSH